MAFFSLDPQIILRREKDGGLIFNPKDAITIEVDKQAFRLLELLDGTRRVKDICIQINTEIRGAFSHHDCNNFLELLIRHGFLIQNSKIQNAKEILPVDPWFKGINLSAPEKVHLMITSSCNFSCKGCYAQQITGTDLTKEQIKNLIKQLAKMKVFQIAIGGGEPFLRDDILEIIQYARENKVLPNITSNGAFLTDELASLLRNYIGKIQFSLVATDRTINDKFRSPGAWKSFLKGCQIARTNKLQFGVNVLITKTTLPLLPQLTNFVLNQGIIEINLLQPKPTSDQDNWFITNKLNKTDLLNLRYILIQLQNRFPQLKLTIDCSLTRLMDHLPERFLQRNGIFGCTAGRRFLTILSNGMVYPCSFLVKDSLFLGNIKNNSVNAIWKKIPEHPSSVLSTIKSKNRNRKLLRRCPAISQITNNPLFLPIHCDNSCNSTLRKQK